VSLFWATLHSLNRNVLPDLYLYVLMWECASERGGLLSFALSEQLVFSFLYDHQFYFASELGIFRE
jgi:hypothetical protein